MPALIEREPLGGRNVGDIAAASSAAGAGAVDPAPQSTPDLISHIISRYHDTHRRELPELVRLARKVEAIHAEHPQTPRGLVDRLQKLLGEIEVHMKKDTPIAQMRYDHDDHDDHDGELQEIEHMTGRFLAPEGACGTWRALYAGLAKFQGDFTADIHLENDVLFPRFERPERNSAAGEEETMPVPSAVAPAIKMHDEAASAAAANPYSGASLMPMLVGGLVMIVLAMIVAMALS